MLKSTAEILPQLSSKQVSELVYTWEDAYGNSAGSIFDEGVTGSYPFSHLIATSLRTITNDMKIDLTRTEFNDLMFSWGKLTPWKGTQEALEILAVNNLNIGVLSNGDYKTLQSDVSIFKPPVKFQYVFPSDFPVGAFKPQPDIYHQTLTLGYDISEILHVAGGSTDASGARDAGLFSVLLAKTGVKKNGRFLFSETPNSKSSQPCFVINDISELPALLGL